MERVCGNASGSNRYLSVGFHQRQMTQDQFTDTVGTSTNGDTSAVTFKKSEASSFTQISSEF